MTDEPTVESVARELTDVLHPHECCQGAYEEVARWALRFRAQGQREVLERAAAVLYKAADDDQLTQRGYGKSHAADILRRLASEVSDGE